MPRVLIVSAVSTVSAVFSVFDICSVYSGYSVFGANMAVAKSLSELYFGTIYRLDFQILNFAPKKVKKMI